MAKNKKPLLQEGTIRRMMKLANMDALGNGFITEKYTSITEDGESAGDESKTHPGDEDFTAKKEKAGQDKRTGAEKRGAEGTLAKTKGHGKVDYVAEDLNEQEDELDVEAEEEVEDVGGEEDVDVEAELDVEEPAAEMEGEITITDEEAQDIIDLAAKLEDAVGGVEEPEEGEEVEAFGAEEELPGGEMEMEMGAEEEELPMQEGLYEAALQGLNIDLVDDKAQRRKAVMQEVKKRIYERVVNRLIKESQAPKKAPRKKVARKQRTKR